MEKTLEETRWRRLLELLAPHHENAAATARRLSRCSADGDDLLQTAVLRAYERLHTLRDEDRFRSWFYAVLLSVHRNRSRRGFWRRFLPLEGAARPWRDETGEDGSRWEEEREQRARITRALATLPPPQREAIVLFELDGFNLEEIAALQEVSVSAVKSRLARGRERLRRYYERLGFGRRGAAADSAPSARRPLTEGGTR